MTSKFNFDILVNTAEGIANIGVKEVYNLDGGEVSYSDYLREGLKTTQSIDIPYMSSFLGIKDKGDGKSLEGQLAYLSLKSNMVNYNATEVYITSSTATKSGLPIVISNFRKASAGFCARRLVQSNVWNDKDEYMKPSDAILASPEYSQWNDDCIVYSLFDNQSFQSSLRQVDYNGKKWDILNQFFWLDSSVMRLLAEEHEFIEMIDDIDAHGTTRHVAGLIDSLDLSQPARLVLDKALELIKTSFTARMVMHSSNPEYHLNTWDAGYAQIKLVTKSFYKQEHNDFRNAVQSLADHLRPKVYEFGFLKQ